MKKYGLLGFPLTHSFSKRYFTEKFEKANLDACYNNFEIDAIEKFPEVVKNNSGIVGFNVTIPYKQQIIPFLNELCDEAREIGAVNTIKVVHTSEGTQFIGFNTDTFGFADSLKPLLKTHHKKALILGTGGASKAVKYVLDQLGIECRFVTRKNSVDNEINYNNLSEEIMKEHTLIVNTTPLGTFPKENTFPPIPYEYISGKHLLYDLVYNPEITQFMAKGKANGAVVKNGYDMLVLQAEKSYKIWNSKE